MSPVPSFPCSLNRQPCLVGRDFNNYLVLSRCTHEQTIRRRKMHQAQEGAHVHITRDTTVQVVDTIESEVHLYLDKETKSPPPGVFECIINTYPPVFEVLLLHLPTSSILDLYHTNRYLRNFLQNYPLAWKNLSFRLPSPPVPLAPALAGFESPDVVDISRKRYSLDLLLRVILPYSNLLTRLELDNTIVSGAELYATVLGPRRSTLQHLSVRGCKDVSVKYHILPFLQMQMATPKDLQGNKPFALQSLYTYRCRHHRRRPYLPSSLIRRDSDSQPTHQLIEICRHLGIWTDTAWCPTPGPRCYRRKDYYGARNGMAQHVEVWVPFDRLWRSQNSVGHTGNDFRTQTSSRAYMNARLWESAEYGHAGEALGADDRATGRGKEPPMHMRSSHKAFIQGFNCHECGVEILERCEQCSVRMHCMGCRKTLCESCAFDRPVRRKRRQVVDHQFPNDINTSHTSQERTKARRDQKKRDRFWWAPGSRRSPNLMSEILADDSSDDEEEISGTAAQLLQPGSNPPPARLNMHWCCSRPTFSGGGGITFLGTQFGHDIRATPLPPRYGFDDPAFPTLKPTSSNSSETSVLTRRTSPLYIPSLPEIYNTISHAHPGHFNIEPLLEQSADPTKEWQRFTSPRSLCTDCYLSTDWRVVCGACAFPVCIEHEVKTLRARRCGFRTLETERHLTQMLLQHKNETHNQERESEFAQSDDFMFKWRPIVASLKEADEERRSHGKWAPPFRKLGESGCLVENLEHTGALDLVLRSEKLNCQDVGNHAGNQSRPSKSPSASRLRSRSLCDFAHIPCNSTGPKQSPTPPDGETQPWTGCERFFCPNPNPQGDTRPRCVGGEIALRSCNNCGVQVCQGCLIGLEKNPRMLERSTPSCEWLSSSDPLPYPCSCKICKSHSFLCPNCACAPDVRAACRFDLEEAVRGVKAEQDKIAAESYRQVVLERWKASGNERSQNDRLIEAMCEFFGASLS